MQSLAPPRFVDPDRFRADPLDFLRAAAARGRPVVRIGETGALFSRSPECRQVVAAFGPEAVRAVLSDAETFGTPVSASETLALTPTLRQLNFGLFSMTGATHARHQQLLRPLFTAPGLAAARPALDAGWRAYRAGVDTGRATGLLAEMRRLILNVSGRIVFGGTDVEIARQIQLYFDLRRRLSAAPERASPAERRELVRLGSRIHRAIAARLAAGPGGNPEGLIDRLRGLQGGAPKDLTDAACVSHANVLFMSSSEPVAVALAWALTLLAQRPDLRAALRGANGPALAERVVWESLRVLPPNAIMARLTRSETVLAGVTLPAACEVVVSPFVAHRDPALFPDPNRFRPERWGGPPPPAYSYFPFGTGARYCLGKALALTILRDLVLRLTRAFDIMLCPVESPVDSPVQQIDWRMDIVLQPDPDPIVRFHPPGAAPLAGARLGGPAARLVAVEAATD